MELTKRHMLGKVPEITIMFWVAKLGTTAFGEAFSDYVFFNDYIGRVLAISMGLALLLVCWAIQFRTRKYTPWVYWLAVTAVSIFGTMSADFMNKDMNMTLLESTATLLVLQATVFAAWYATEKTLDVHSINTFRREAFYWATVLLTFELGTAASDYASVSLNWGTLKSTWVFLAIIMLPAISSRFVPGISVFLFWFAYTITRPLGAAFADWLGVPAPYGDGLQIGTGPISLVTGLVLLGIVGATDVLHRRASALTSPDVSGLAIEV